MKKLTKNIYGRMDYRKKPDESVNFQKKINRAFPKDSLSFLCAWEKERQGSEVTFSRIVQNNRARQKNEIVSERGITLLALIITVVIMIILAAVTLNITLGDGGIIDQAKTAAESTVNSAQSEQEQLDSLEQELANLLAKPEGPPEIGDIKPSTPEEVDIFDNTTKVIDESGDEVWIPGGFGLDEETATDADDGIVITDAKGNEFVWIPVPDYTTMYEDTAGSVKLNGVETTTSVYSKLRVRSGDSYTVTPPGQTTGIREPDVLSSYDTSSSYYQTILGYGSTKLMADAFVDEYTATYNSIKKYKGFYIGRYELTGTVTNPTVQRDRKVLTNQNWYNLKKACSNIVSSSYAQSEMIYGNQWDEVMSWLVKTGEKTDSEVNSNSASWGNYSNSTGNAAEGSGTKRTSGYSEYWKANNIYDLAGNCRDWTQEAYSPYDRVSRGGTIGSFYPASDRSDNNPDYSNSYYSARSALYIKVGL